MRCPLKIVLMISNAASILRHCGLVALVCVFVALGVAFAAIRIPHAVAKTHRNPKDSIKLRCAVTHEKKIARLAGLFKTDGF